MKKNFLLTFITACVPGCGQMYQGFMKRGLSILLLASGITMVAGIMRLESLLFLLPAVWLFSFFDTYNIRGFSAEKRAAMEDKFIFSDYGIKISKLKINGNKWLGIGLVVVGLYAFYNTTISGFVGTLVNDFGLYWVNDIFYAMPSLVMAVALVLLGIHLIKGSMPKKEEIQEYKGIADAQITDNEE